MELKNLIAGVCALGGVTATAETVEYWDPVGKVTNSVEAVVVTAGTETLTGGWYVVTGEVTFPEVQKPSDAAGFFTIGVSATKGK